MSVILHLVRTIVFLAGMFWGYMFGVLVLSFGGSTATDFTGVFGASGSCWLHLCAGSLRSVARRAIAGPWAT
jgi:hypothetical protein